MGTNKSHEPLLYIHQPDWEYPESDMQETYLIKKADAELLTNESTKESVAANDNQMNLAQNDEQAAVSIMEKETEEDRAQVNLENIEYKEKQEETQVELITLETGTIERKENSPVKAAESSEIQQIINQYEKDRQEESDESVKSLRTIKTTSFKRVKSFKEMNAVEKVHYLVNIPKLLPPVPCIFITSNSSIRGFLMSQMDEEIQVRTFDEKIVEIQINQLNEIKIIGFK